MLELEIEVLNKQSHLAKTQREIKRQANSVDGLSECTTTRRINSEDI